MTEKYLHSIWESKRIAPIDLTTVKGHKLEILSFGIRNDHLAGPDFFYGKIRLGSEVLVGNIEIHIKSSDWYRHNHHNDPNYNNVILHVVHEFDRAVVQNGHEIPTLVIGPFIDSDHLRKYEESRWRINRLICSRSCASVPGVYFTSMMSKSLEEKYLDKLRFVQSEFGEIGDDELMYILMAMAFGTGVNKEGFVDLVRRVPLSSLKYVARRKRAQLMLAESGVLNEGTNDSFLSQWNFKGVRPGSFPHIRILQFARISTSFEFSYFSDCNDAHALIDFFITSITKEDKENNNYQLSSFMKDHLIINCLAPFLWLRGQRSEDLSFIEMSWELLSGTKAENNNIIKKWKKAGVTVNNAYESQGLLSLYKYFCCHKKCLSCEIGNALMIQ